MPLDNFNFKKKKNQIISKILYWLLYFIVGGCYENFNLCT